MLVTTFDEALYATAKEAGKLAAPDWLPRGGMVEIHTEQGAFCYMAADEAIATGSRSVEANEQRDAPAEHCNRE